MTNARKLIVPILFGVIGAAILVGLGVWQMQRLAWKEAILAGIEARVHDTPVALPAAPDPVRDLYLPVRVSGRFTEAELHILASRKGQGAGFRIVTAYETTDGRRIMVDRGYLPEAEIARPRLPVDATLTGNLHWPQEVDSYTPAPDATRNLWFARDIPAMAAALRTEPVLLILRETDENDAPVSPMPLDSAGIPNDHLQYAITWFSLAVVWLGMTGLLLWRITRRKE